MLEGISFFMTESVRERERERERAREREREHKGEARREKEQVEHVKACEKPTWYR